MQQTACIHDRIDVQSDNWTPVNEATNRVYEHDETGIVALTKPNSNEVVAVGHPTVTANPTPYDDWVESLHYDPALTEDEYDAIMKEWQDGLDDEFFFHGFDAPHYSDTGNIVATHVPYTGVYGRMGKRAVKEVGELNEHKLYDITDEVHHTLLSQSTRGFDNPVIDLVCECNWELSDDEREAILNSGGDE